MAHSINTQSGKAMCVVCGETDFTDHKPCPLSMEGEKNKIEAAKSKIEAEKNKIEAAKNKIDADKIRAGMPPVS